MAVKRKETFVCSECGAQSLQWQGQCPKCNAWNSLEARVVEPARAGAKSVGASLGFGVQSVASAVCLQEVESQNHAPFSTGLAELDRILGHGLMPGAALLVGGEPGIGKSTLLLQLAGAVAAGGRRVLYFSGEESLLQLRDRAKRLNLLHENLLALCSSRVDDILPLLENPAEAPSLLIVDSVQTVTSLRAEGLPGSVSQVRAVATELAELCRTQGITVLFVGHVTKDGQLAGPKLLEHMVDTVISLEGDRRQQYRMMRILKNRFGANQELLVFRMEEKGMSLVDDPSTFFLEARDPSLSGTSLVMAVDGQRPLVVEVQALVSRSYLAIPRRTALGFDVNRLHLLLAVMEKRLRLNFSQVDIYTKIGGGIRLQDPGMDVALVAAILSSFYDLSLPERCISWGEVDLNGQIRPVTAQVARYNQAKRLGYTPILCPVDGKNKGLQTIMALQEQLFRRAPKGKSVPQERSAQTVKPQNAAPQNATPQNSEMYDSETGEVL